LSDAELLEIVLRDDVTPNLDAMMIAWANMTPQEREAAHKEGEKQGHNKAAARELASRRWGGKLPEELKGLAELLRTAVSQAPDAEMQASMLSQAVFIFPAPITIPPIVEALDSMQHLHEMETATRALGNALNSNGGQGVTNELRAIVAEAIARAYPRMKQAIIDGENPIHGFIPLNEVVFIFGQCGAPGLDAINRLGLSSGTSLDARAMINTPEAIAQIVDAYHRADSDNVRESCVRALAQHRIGQYDPPVQDLLREEVGRMLVDDDPFRRECGANYAMGLGEPAFEAQLKLLAEGDPHMIVRDLGGLNPETMETTSKPTEVYPVREAAAAALEAYNRRNAKDPKS
ncbi:MAG: hypothetical protein WC655_09665, partial [Candidatus Hydrogenedentales bacterium]